MNVVAAVIEKDGKFLLCQRPPGKNMAFHWEFPGGKIEPGESGEQAIHRELQEELGIQAKAIRLLTEIKRSIGSEDLNLFFYLTRIEQGVPEKLEHHDFAWVSKEHLLDYDLCQSDYEFVCWLLKQPD